MKAISIRQPWADFIVKGVKTIETRTWTTDYRGDILICSSKLFDPAWNDMRLEYRNSLAYGKALCIAELYDIKPMTAEHQEEAGCKVYPGAYSWFLRNIRLITPFLVKGKLRLFEVEYEAGR